VKLRTAHLMAAAMKSINDGGYYTAPHPAANRRHRLPHHEATGKPRREMAKNQAPHAAKEKRHACPRHQSQEISNQRIKIFIRRQNHTITYMRDINRPRAGGRRKTDPAPHLAKRNHRKPLTAPKSNENNRRNGINLSASASNQQNNQHAKTNTHK